MGYAAQGGRIGFNSGGETAYEKWLIDKYDLLVSDLSWDDHSKYSKLFRDQKAQGGRIGYNSGSQGSRYTYLTDKISKGIPLTPPELEELQMLEITYADVDRDPSAEGGRIGYNLGGIDRPFQGTGALNPRMGYAFGEEVEQVTEEVTPFAKIPENIKKADLDDIPNWWLTDFEQLIEDFKIDNNGQNPTSINQLEKWYRFKHGTSAQAGPNIDEMLNIGVTDENTNPQEVEQLLGSMQAAQGGRIGAQEGGLMNLGGMEKDYRQEGGFVPLGGEEKADDVPARLSKNEFVFTADAVRAAGGGDVDAGAEVMENIMENLEAGGEISEESQGLEGARGMFANAQQLQKRII
jgi:hypothetical protein